MQIYESYQLQIEAFALMCKTNEKRFETLKSQNLSEP